MERAKSTGVPRVTGKGGREGEKKETDMKISKRL